MESELFLGETFQNALSTLPVQNLGELLFIVQRDKEAFTCLDMSLKLYKNLNKNSLTQFKALALLGSLLDRQGDEASMKRIHDVIFKQLDQIDCYEKVFAMRNYGYILAKKEATRLEGNDFIKKADEL